MAQARYEQDTLFLTRFESGWRVLAAWAGSLVASPTCSPSA